jgi:uncharacterized protein
MGSFRFRFLEQNLLLLPQKAVFWEDTGILLIADLHLGKVSHFRKAGIPVPQAAIRRNYEVLDELLQIYQVSQIIILGDLFHSVINAEWGLFVKWLTRQVYVKFELVKGNHDILPTECYEISNLAVHQETLLVSPFIFSHIPLESKPASYYNLSGHVHPAVRLRGPGGQQLTLPCFYFGKMNGLLPAFGSFTGKATIWPEKESYVFAVAEEQVLSLGQTTSN